MWKIAGLLLLVVTCSGHADHSSSASPCCACPQFWTFYNGSCYRFFGERITWQNAEDHCDQFYTTAGRAHLVSIHDEDENSFVYEMFRSSSWDTPSWQGSTRPTPFYGVWLGLYQDTQGYANIPWVYSDGTAFDFDKWRSGEPNNNYYGRQPENCVHIWRLNDASDTTQDWNDMYCADVMSFVCKMPAQ